MSLDLIDYEQRTREAVATFWRARRTAGTTDNRAAVVGGKNLDGFVDLLRQVVIANGLDAGDVQFQGRAALTLPGYFRPTKQWDLLVMHENELIAAFELKSHVGPSFGNNFNNRCEEALGSAADFWIAVREGVLQSFQRPFLGYLIVVEDCEAARRPVRTASKFFDVLPEFVNASTLDRYRIFCQKLMAEGLYQSASLIMTPGSAHASGEYTDWNLRGFIAGFAAHVATRAAMGQVSS
jgi:hypothetical protein